MSKLINKRYQVEKPLGAGGMGEVLLVKDRFEEDRPLALKRVLADEKESEKHLTFLKLEFDVLRRLHHPNLARVFDFGTDEEGHFFFTSEFIEGENLLEFFKRGLNLEETVEILVQVCRALNFIHSRRYIHGDLKPSNILVSRVQGETIAHLVDFGTARVVGQRHQGAGTPKYLPPEVLAGHPSDHKSDLYALGVLLGDILNQGIALDQGSEKLNQLEAIRDKLTSPTSYRRFQSARDVVDALAKVSDTEFALETAETRSAYLHLPKLVGRDQEVDALISFCQPTNKKHYVACIRGPQGSGKTRLLDEIVAATQADKLLWIRLQAGSRRLMACELAHRLVSFLGEDDPAVKNNRVPLMALARGEADGQTLEPLVLGSSLLNVVKAAQRKCPVVIAFDGCDHAEHLDLELIGFLSRSVITDAEKDSAKIILAMDIASSANKKLTDTLKVAGYQNALDIDLKNLQSPEEVQGYLQVMLGESKPTLAFSRKVLSATGGNPEFIRQFMSTWLASGPNLEKRELDESDLKDTETPASLLELIKKRLAQLHAQELECLSLLSLCNRAVPFEVLKRAAGTDAALETTLNKLCHQDLAVLTYEDDTLVSVSKEVVRMAGREQLAARDTKALHERLAMAFEKTDHLKGFEDEYAWHLIGAQKKRSAFETTLNAVNMLKGQFNHVRALTLLDALYELERNAPKRVDILFHRAEIHSTLGNSEASLRDLETLLSMDRKHLAGHKLLAEVLKSTGDFEEARHVLESALKLKPAQSDRQSILTILAEVMVLSGESNKAVNTLRPWVNEKHQIDDPEAARHLVESLNTLGLAYFYLGGFDDSISMLTRALDLKSQAKNIKSYITTLYRLGMALYSKSNLDEALKAYAKARELAENRGDVKQLCSVELNLGALYQKQGKLERSFISYERGFHAAMKMGDRTNLLVARYNLGNLIYLLGDFEVAREHLDAALSIAEKQNAPFMKSFCLLSKGMLEMHGKKLNEARSALCQSARLLWHLKQSEAYVRPIVELGHLHLKAKSFRKAYHYYQRGTARLKPDSSAVLYGELQLLASETGFVEPQKVAETLERALERLEVEDTLEARDLIWRLHFRLSQTFQKLEQSNYVQYHLRRARAAFDDAIQSIPDTFKRGFEQAPNRKPLLMELNEQLSEFTSTALANEDIESLSRVLINEADKLEPILKINRKLNSLLDLDSLLDVMMDIIMEMSQAEHGYLLVKEGQDFKTYAHRNLSREDSRASESISRMVMESGKPLITKDALQDKRTESLKTVVDLELKSILCLPFRLKEQVIGVVYLEHRTRADVFDPNRVGVIEGIVDQAAIALHNARLHTQIVEQEKKIRQLNRKLQSQLDEKAERLEETEKMLANQQYQLIAKYKMHNIIAKSKRMRDVLSLVDRISDSRVSVLILGESGTGKELVARAIHFNGPDKSKPFLTINCSALNDQLLESELFGHEKGSFTGADRTKRGLFEVADGGTLFLDEVGDMSKTMQTKLLRALQEGEIRRVGGTSVIHVDVRIVAATNVDIDKAVKNGTFREDLFYRLNTIQMKLPPLRKRREDIPVLVRHFIAQSQKPELKISASALDRLDHYDWPGNVRELENEINRALIFAEDQILPEHLSPKLQGEKSSSSKVLGDGVEDLLKSEELDSILAKVEKEVLIGALAMNKGKKGVTAKKLGMTRYTLYRKLKQHGLDDE